MCPTDRREVSDRVMFILIFIVLLAQPISCNRLEIVNHRKPQADLLSRAKACPKVSFELYDGYEWREDKDVNVSSTSPLHFGVSDLPECLGLCLANDKCEAVNYNGHTCQHLEGLHSRDNDDHLDYLRASQHPGLSFNIHARKICLDDVSNRCGCRIWAFEHVIGYQLRHPASEHFSKRRIISPVSSLSQCRDLCLGESRFVCRSASYDSRSEECLLSDMNRHTIENTYSDRVELANNNKPLKIKFVSTQPFDGHVHYLENKCIPEPRKFCDFRRLRSQQLKTVDRVVREVESVSECRELCIANHETLACKSFDFDGSNCRLSHLSESSTIHLGEPYAAREDVITFEISTCYNVSISCLPRVMQVSISTSRLFNGKIYAKSQPKSCTSDIDNSLGFGLSLPYFDRKHVQVDGSETFVLTSSANESEAVCDTRQPEVGNFANDIVIQHHDLVMTTKDLSLGVYCKFDLTNDSVTRIDLRIQGDIMTDQLKGSALMPNLTLHVVDGKGREIDEVSIGDLLRLQVRMSDEDTYGIFVRNLIARDSFNQSNNVTLIDNKGCPVEVKMMREMRTLDDQSKSLESYFEAFTFTGGSLMIIEAEVETCLDKCKPIQCKVPTGRSDDDAELVTSYGRRRRRRRRSLDTNQAEVGDVLSMTMLSKSLLIRSPRHSNEMARSSEMGDFPASSSNNKTPTIIRRKTTTNKMINSALQDSSIKPPPTSVYLKISLGDKSYICFEPLNLLILCCLSFLVQGCFFSLIFYLLLRVKLRSYKDRLSIPWMSSKNVKNNLASAYTNYREHHAHSHRDGNTHQPYNFMR